MNNSFIDRVNAIVQQNQSTDPAYPDAGIGALENVANNVPRQAQLMNQPHMLAYINPQEEQMLRDMGGAGLPGPDGIPVYGFFDWAKETASNIGSSIKETASNVYNTVSTAATNTFGDQGSVETFFDTYVADFDGDSTPTNTVYGTGPLEEVTSGPITYTDNNGVEHSTQAAADAANVVIAERSTPLTLSYTSTKTKEQLIAEARAAGQSVYAFNGNWEPVPDEVVETEDTVGALPTGSNSITETLANLVTPFDSAYYEDGTLYGYDKDGNVIDLTGGGESYSNLTGTSNYVYGVADDAGTGTAVNTTDMSEDEATIAQTKDDLLKDIPPDDLAYFASFFGNSVIPYFGGAIAGKMLDAGIEERRAYMDAEIAALEAGANPTYNAAGEYTGHDTGATDQYNLNYDPTGGNTTTATGALPTTTTTTAADAAEEAANSMKEAGILSLGGKQTPDDPDIVGNTPIFQYNGENGSYEVVGGLTEGEDPSLSTNADGTLFIPYDGEDPHTIAGEGFATDLTPNGAAVAHVVGKNHLLNTGDDSKMVVGIEGGGYKLIDGTELTNKVLENIITEGVNDGTLSADLLDTYGLEGGAEAAAAIDTTDEDPLVSKIYNRFFRSGNTAGLPIYMAKWMDGVDFDERLEKVMVEGKVMYKNAEGDLISAKDLETALKYDNDGNIIETED